MVGCSRKIKLINASMPAAFPKISKIAYEGPKSKTRSRSNTMTPTKSSLAKPCAIICALPWCIGTRSGARQRSVRAGTMHVRGMTALIPSSTPRTASVAFEFIEKLSAPYYCWHDRDMWP